MPYDLWAQLWGLGVPSATYQAAAWPSANRAYYIPFQLPVDAYAYALWARGNNTTGNYDLGLYDENFARITSKGSTALAAALLEHLFELRLYAGRTYYMAMSESSTGSVFRATCGSVARAAQMGLASQDSAHALPSTMTPVDAASDYIPLLALGIR